MDNDNDVEMSDAEMEAEALTLETTSRTCSKQFQFCLRSSQFDDLPIQLYNEIFKYLTIEERNKIREVAVAWDHAIKYAFGLKIILNNHNIHDMSPVNDILDIQVRNLTKKLPESLAIHIFEYASKVRHLEIMGMILSTNLIKLLTEFKSITTLKLSRVYLETDRNLRLTDEIKENLPANLNHLKMTFLKTFHHKNYLRFARGRNTASDLYNLASSDNIILTFIQNFNLERLQTLELYHEMDDDSRIKRHSEMVNRIRSQIQMQIQNQNQNQNHGAGDGDEMFEELQNQQNLNLEINQQQDFETDGTRAISNILLSLISLENIHIKNLRLDNFPQIAIPEIMVNNDALDNLQLSHIELAGILSEGWIQILNVQRELKSLQVYLLEQSQSQSLIDAVKNAVCRCETSLETLTLIVGTPDALILNSNPAANLNIVPGQNQIQNQNQNQNPNQNQNLELDFALEDPTDFDTSFLTNCHRLKNLKIYFAPRKIDLRGLPTKELNSLEICGRIVLNELMQLIERSQSPNLEFLKLDICDGPQSAEVPPERQILSQVADMKAILEKSSVTKLVISEAGAFENFKRFLSLNELLSPLENVRTSIDFVEYRSAALLPLIQFHLPGAGVEMPGIEDAGRLTFVSVPRITIQVAK